jgi:FAD/FMN-containing dehydrogenase
MQHHLDQISKLVRGELERDVADLERASVDGSIFTILPQAVLYPKDAGDIQAVIHYLFQQAQQGMPVPSVTARGRGSDQAGGPLGDGIIIDTTRHLTQILEIGEEFVRVEPGCRYGELQDELKKRGNYLPPYPASLEICTIGGAVSNNSSGEKTVKYGNTRDYVTGLKVVLASGDEVEVRALHPAEVHGKGHHYTFEGKVYRELAALLKAHVRKEEHPHFHVTKNSTGYCVWLIEEKGMFDLCKLIVGSQGTLGIITEITLKTLPYPKVFSLTAAYFSSIDRAAHATTELHALGPSALEIVDKNLLDLVEERQPGHLKGLVPSPIPQIVLLVEFDEQDDHRRAAKTAAASTILEKYAYEHRLARSVEEQDRFWLLRRSAAAVIWTVEGPVKALPIVEDGVVPPAKLPEFFIRAYELFRKYDLKIAVWGHAGDANLHMQPFMNLSDPLDREKIWPFVDEFHALIISMGGCISAEHNDGLLRSPYLQAQYGEELYGIFRKVKRIFDPYNYLNPGKKVDVHLEDIKKYLRDSYSLTHLVEDRESINR